MATVFSLIFKKRLHCNFHTCHFNILKYLIHNESEKRNWAEPSRPKGGHTLWGVIGKMRNLWEKKPKKKQFPFMNTSAGEVFP